MSDYERGLAGGHFLGGLVITALNIPDLDVNGLLTGTLFLIITLFYLNWCRIDEVEELK